MKKLLTFILSLLLGFTCINLNYINEEETVVNVDNTTTSQDDDSELKSILERIANANTSEIPDKSNLNTIIGNGEGLIRAYGEDSEIEINGVVYYVLDVDKANGTARLITKDIYDVRFYSDHDSYGYAGSDLQKWLNETFYNEKLKK